MLVLMDEALLSKGTEFEADIVTDVVTDVDAAKQVQSRYPTAQNVPTLVLSDSAPNFETRLGGLRVKPVDQIEKTCLEPVPRTQRKEALKVLSLVEEAWARKSSDDVRFALRMLIDSCMTPVTMLKSLRPSNKLGIRTSNA